MMGFAIGAILYFNYFLHFIPFTISFYFDKHRGVGYKNFGPAELKAFFNCFIENLSDKQA